QDQALPERDPFGKLAELFASSAPLTRLTEREKAVCLRILAGFSSEAISAELGIGLHSTLTYRKRAYEKLGISSQNELFAIALRLLASPRHLNYPSAAAVCPNPMGQTRGTVWPMLVRQNIFEAIP